ncbi:hypothetical protein [Branchiibius sp. NY16-3462-2]|uniref:hypothetical protein n=1 Tax=Branchiibius sp. NY16-3462-2 TaxID=1807500 RepID=UPI00079BE271|nr:hypothetical protein [Branchiibius sp. NY16-3462-2]KYH44783.1 hypothetical protein AZH51_12210 [Branchiibius sp. NY16-3462-2]
MQHTSLLDPDSPQHIWAYTRGRLDDEMQIAYPGCRFVAERIEPAEHNMVRIVREYEAGTPEQIGAGSSVAP